jgi:hypothetical protein
VASSTAAFPKHQRRSNVLVGPAPFPTRAGRDTYLKRPVTRRRTARMMICRPRRSSRLFFRPARKLKKAANSAAAPVLRFLFGSLCRPRSHQSTGSEQAESRPLSSPSPARAEPWTNAPPVDTAESERTKFFYVFSLSLFLFLGYSTNDDGLMLLLKPKRPHAIQSDRSIDQHEQWYPKHNSDCFAASGSAAASGAGASNIIKVVIRDERSQ